MTADLLNGVRVLDMTNVLAGPFAAYQLALLGADVIKLEVPKTGDLARQLGVSPELSGELLGASFLAQNAAKRSVTVNLKNEDGKELFRRMLADADVLIENFRPGVLARLGFDHETMQAINPRLVYCAVSGFGATGPMADRPAYDQVIQGLSGIMSVTGTPEIAPLRVGFPVCDTIGGLGAALAIVSAVVRQRATGEGCRLDVSMLDAAITAMGWVVSDHLLAGRIPQPMANENITSAPSGTFHTGDGEINIAANKQEQYEALCRVLEREELLTDPRFVTRNDRKANRDELRAELEVTLRGHPTSHWDQALLAVGVPAAPVLTVPEALRSEQVVHRQLITELDLPALDTRMHFLGSATHVDGGPALPEDPPPTLGQHTDEFLAELGYTTEQIAEMHESGAI